jgi:hypothetical protein
MRLVIWALLLVPQDSPVKDLLDQLGSEILEARESAEEALKKRGRTILPELRRAAQGHVDAEVRARAQAVIRHFTEVRWRIDLEGALRTAARLKKPVLVFSTMGAPEDYL